MARLSALALLAAAAAPAAAVRMQQRGSVRELVSSSPSMASGVSAHRPLCDAAVVHETCGVFRPDATAVSPADVQDVLSATPASVASLWSYMGLAGPTPCAKLCQRVVQTLARFTVVPPESDLGCFRVGNQTVCNIDLDPAKVLDESRFDGSLPDFHDKEVRAEAVAEGADLGEDDVLGAFDPRKSPSFAELIRLSYSGIDYSVEDLLRRVANMFRIFPAEDISVLEQHEPSSSFVEGGVTGNAELFQKVNYEARQYVDGAVRMLKQKKKDEVIGTWFGAAAPASEAVRAEIQRVLNSVQAMLRKVQFVYPGPECNDRTYAYVFPKSLTCFADDASWRKCTTNTMGQFIFYMCKPVLAAKRSVQIETITHEGSHHATAFTDDIAYSRENCTKLALEEPEKAIKNADNFCYYVQDMTDR